MCKGKEKKGRKKRFRAELLPGSKKTLNWNVMEFSGPRSGPENSRNERFSGFLDHGSSSARKRLFLPYFASSHLMRRAHLPVHTCVSFSKRFWGRDLHRALSNSKHFLVYTRILVFSKHNPIHQDLGVRAKSWCIGLCLEKTRILVYTKKCLELLTRGCLIILPL